MLSPLTFGDHGTPITLLETHTYPDWLTQQSDLEQNWLHSSDYQGKGLCLIPDAEGGLARVIYGVASLKACFACGDLVKQLPGGDYRLESSDESLLNTLALAWGVGAYCFDRYQSPARALPTLVLPQGSEMESVQQQINAIGLVRDLINTPAADMMPQHLAKAAEQLAYTFHAELSQIIGDDLLRENYPTIHAVGRASINPPRLIDLHWGNPDHPKLTLVGKGVCFDSGGLDLKSGLGMRNMKKDMGGAAHVLGLAQLIMAHQLPVRLRVLIPAVENAVANNAYRPGDVITTRKGLTVEIDNTDAEGRLVLCDALAEADREDPDLIIDFATLTGAARIALGTELPGFFSNQSSLAQALMAAGALVDDPVWSLPLHQDYQYLLDSEVADLVNCPETPMGGAIVAALYLQHFVRPDTAWCHFDIMAFNKRARPGQPIGGEAMGMRAVFAYLQARYQ